MISVVKLKAVVDNKDLPVLTRDGEIVSYYAGAYKNKLMEVGYTPTPAQMTAIGAFIEDGMNNGWIDQIKYFLPFIGNSNVPLSGAVPLIDSIDNYQMSEYTFTEDLSKIFVYDSSGQIISMGGPTITPNSQVLKTPVKVSDMGGGLNVSACIGPFVRDNSYLSYFAYQTVLSSGSLFRGIRINGSGLFDIIYRRTIDAASANIIAISRPTGAEIDNLWVQKKDFSLNIAYFKDEADGNNYYMRFITTPDKSLENYDKGISKSFVAYEGDDSLLSKYNATYGMNQFSCLIPIKSWGVFDYHITRQQLADFNAAVFTLNTALGR